MVVNSIKVGVLGLILMCAINSCSSSGSSDMENEFLEKLKTVSEIRYDTKRINDLYSVDIPQYMASTTALNTEATLQYNNVYKEKYIIVLDEDKKTMEADLKNYGLYNEDQTMLEMFADAKEALIVNESAVIGEIERKDLKIDGLNASMTEFDSNVEGITDPVTYYLCFVEGEKNLYTVMAWTLTSRKDDFKEEAMKMIKSFREL